jgi:hypothetical protein
MVGLTGSAGGRFEEMRTSIAARRHLDTSIYEHTEQSLRRRDPIAPLF